MAVSEHTPILSAAHHASGGVSTPTRRPLNLSEINISLPLHPMRDEIMKMFGELPSEDQASFARLAWAMVNKDVDRMLDEADSLGLREPVQATIHAHPERYNRGGAA
ncbi:hypothetical protein [Azospirillum palustre]|uniref:hypothetical protein n=1 Tax=Azospirillum palustre TaxID=2044885 RepID=UPI00117744E4|nr:hypothetical protein [Azospirillum palustre]